MDWKETVTTFSENVFPGISYKVERELEGSEIKANLPLQVTAYFNVVFIPVWLSVILIFIVQSFDYLDQLKQFLLITLFVTVFIIECLRLFMVYVGNLNDKIPELACFWMLSLFLQVPLQSIFLFTPYFQLGVLEVTSQSIMVILLVFETIFGYFALRLNWNTASEDLTEQHFHL
ncbi:hypothetical protein GWI33_001708 [Rhynchophorus ferrugineus]|uniref:Transmembrane protein 17-like protein n=1 Tax=Rhynchophorus ferrugineus TaxID=354439 RepID=A0A834IZV9_RHYFE|nr:hypothetical protein GWI33_001708 [Rhynchophorus ferrugineus]